MYISIDCDNVLCDTARAFIRYYEEEYGDVVEYDTITHAYLQDNAQFAKFPHDGTYGAYMDFFEHATRAGYLLPIA